MNDFDEVQKKAQDMTSNVTDGSPAHTITPDKQTGYKSYGEQGDPKVKTEGQTKIVSSPKDDKFAQPYVGGGSYPEAVLYGVSAEKNPNVVTLQSKFDPVEPYEIRFGNMAGKTDSLNMRKAFAQVGSMFVPKGIDWGWWSGYDMQLEPPKEDFAHGFARNLVNLPAQLFIETKGSIGALTADAIGSYGEIFSDEDAIKLGNDMLSYVRQNTDDNLTTYTWSFGPDGINEGENKWGGTFGNLVGSIGMSILSPISTAATFAAVEGFTNGYEARVAAMDRGVGSLKGMAIGLGAGAGTAALGYSSRLIEGPVKSMFKPSMGWAKTLKESPKEFTKQALKKNFVVGSYDAITEPAQDLWSAYLGQGRITGEDWEQAFMTLVAGAAVGTMMGALKTKADKNEVQARMEYANIVTEIFNKNKETWDKVIKESNGQITQETVDAYREFLLSENARDGFAEFVLNRYAENVDRMNTWPEEYKAALKNKLKNTDKTVALQQEFEHLDANIDALLSVTKNLPEGSKDMLRSVLRGVAMQNFVYTGRRPSEMKLPQIFADIKAGKSPYTTQTGELHIYEDSDFANAELSNKKVSSTKNMNANQQISATMKNAALDAAAQSKNVDLRHTRGYSFTAHELWHWIEKTTGLNNVEKFMKKMTAWSNSVLPNIQTKAKGSTAKSEALAYAMQYAKSLKGPLGLTGDVRNYMELYNSVASANQAAEAFLAYNDVLSQTIKQNSATIDMILESYGPQELRDSIREYVKTGGKGMLKSEDVKSLYEVMSSVSDQASTEALGKAIGDTTLAESFIDRYEREYEAASLEDQRRALRAADAAKAKVKSQAKSISEQSEQLQTELTEKIAEDTKQEKPLEQKPSENTQSEPKTEEPGYYQWNSSKYYPISSEDPQWIERILAGEKVPAEIHDGLYKKYSDMARSILGVSLPKVRGNYIIRQNMSPNKNEGVMTAQWQPTQEELEQYGLFERINGGVNLSSDDLTAVGRYLVMQDMKKVYAIADDIVSVGGLNNESFAELAANEAVNADTAARMYVKSVGEVINGLEVFSDYVGRSGGNLSQNEIEQELPLLEEALDYADPKWLDDMSEEAQKAVINFQASIDTEAIFDRIDSLTQQYLAQDEHGGLYAERKNDPYVRAIHLPQVDPFGKYEKDYGDRNKIEVRAIDGKLKKLDKFLEDPTEKNMKYLLSIRKDLLDFTESKFAEEGKKKPLKDVAQAYKEDLQKRRERLDVTGAYEKFNGTYDSYRRPLTTVERYAGGLERNPKYYDVAYWTSNINGAEQLDTVEKIEAELRKAGINPVEYDVDFVEYLDGSKANVPNFLQYSTVNPGEISPLYAHNNPEMSSINMPLVLSLSENPTKDDIILKLLESARAQLPRRNQGQLSFTDKLREVAAIGRAKMVADFVFDRYQSQMQSFAQWGTIGTGADLKYIEGANGAKVAQKMNSEVGPYISDNATDVTKMSVGTRLLVPYQNTWKQGVITERGITYDNHPFYVVRLKSQTGSQLVDVVWDAREFELMQKTPLEGFSCALLLKPDLLSKEDLAKLRDMDVSSGKDYTYMFEDMRNTREKIERMIPTDDEVTDVSDLYALSDEELKDLGLYVGKDTFGFDDPFKNMSNEEFENRDPDQWVITGKETTNEEVYQKMKHAEEARKMTVAEYLGKKVPGFGGSIESSMDVLTDVVEERKHHPLLFFMTRGSGPHQQIANIFGSDIARRFGLTRDADSAERITEAWKQNVEAQLIDNVFKTQKAFGEWQVKSSLDLPIKAVMSDGKERPISRREIAVLKMAQRAQEGKVKIPTMYGGAKEADGVYIYKKLRSQYKNFDQLLEQLTDEDIEFVKVMEKELGALRAGRYDKSKNVNPNETLLPFIPVNSFDDYAKDGWVNRRFHNKAVFGSKLLDPNTNLVAIDMYQSAMSLAATAGLRESNYLDTLQVLQDMLNIASLADEKVRASRGFVAELSDKDREALTKAIASSEKLKESIINGIGASNFSAFMRGINDDLTLDNSGRGGSKYTEAFQKLTRTAMSTALALKPRQFLTNLHGNFAVFGGLSGHNALYHNTIGFMNALMNFRTAWTEAMTNPTFRARWEKSALSEQFRRAADMKAESLIQEVEKIALKYNKGGIANALAAADAIAKLSTKWGIGATNTLPDFIGLAMGRYAVHDAVEARVRSRIEATEGHANSKYLKSEERFEARVAEETENEIADYLFSHISSSNIMARGHLSKSLARMGVEGVMAFTNDQLQKSAALANAIDRLYNSTDESTRTQAWREIENIVTSNVVYVAIQAGLIAAAIKLLSGEDLSEKEEEYLTFALSREAIGQITGAFQLNALSQPLAEYIMFGKNNGMDFIPFSDINTIIRNARKGDYASALGRFTSLIGFAPADRAVQIIRALSMIFGDDEYAASVGWLMLGGRSESTAKNMGGLTTNKDGKIVPKKENKKK